MPLAGELRKPLYFETNSVYPSIEDAILRCHKIVERGYLEITEFGIISPDGHLITIDVSGSLKPHAPDKLDNSQAHSE
jgi:hypothetical protein